MAFNQPYQQNFTNVLSEDEFLSIIEPPPPQTPPIEEPRVFSEDEFSTMIEPLPPRDKDDETREAEELLKELTEGYIEDELDKEVERLKRIDEQDRRREMRRLARKTPQQLAEQRRRHEHEIGMARARIRINPLIGEEVSSRDRILTRVSTPRLIVREPPNITIAEPVRNMNQQYIANSLPRARARRPQRGLYF